jgi:hypothetical protein
MESTLPASMFISLYQRAKRRLFMRAQILLLASERAMRDAATEGVCQYRRLLA